MTGFAAKTLTLTIDEENKAHVSIHLKSLNARYFEVNAKLPHALSYLETDVIKLFKNKLLRGYIYFTVHVDNPNIFKGTIQPAMGTIQGYLQAIARIKKEAGIKQDVALEHIIRLPDIFNVEKKGIDEKSAQIILTATNELIEQVIKERSKEGQALKKDIEQRVVVMHKEIEHIEKRSKKSIEEQKEKVHQVLQELADDPSELAEARKNALYMVLDKIDIHEEIVRFKSHLDNITTQLASPEIEKGKRLDFTLQELAREINTIAAKCSDSAISSRAINIKVEIEKAREQAQNIV